MSKLPEAEIEVVERRVEPDLAAIWNLLRAVDTKVDTHIAESEVTRPKIDRLLSVFEQAQGAITFVKWMAAVAASGAAAWAWLNTYVTWRH